MHRFAKRRLIASSITLLLIILFVAAVWIVQQRLGHAAFLSGSVLLSCVFLLILLGIRRRIPMLPLLKMSTWVQIHIYTGLFAMVAFFFHVPNIITDGLFESGLSILFLAVSASGLYGVYVSRTAPKRLTAVPGQYRYEQIGWHRYRIAEMANQILDQLKSSPAAAVLADFYSDSLQPFFEARPRLSYVMIPTGVRRRRLLAGLGELNRYLEPESKKTAGQFAALVRLRDDLDYHFALQLRLRVWVAVHAIMSCGLLIWAIVHALLALQFFGN